MFSAGKVIVTNHCKTADLTPDAFLGSCLFAEAYAGYGVGASIYVMYSGIPPASERRRGCWTESWSDLRRPLGCSLFASAPVPEWRPPKSVARRVKGPCPLARHERANAKV